MKRMLLIAILVGPTVGLARGDATGEPVHDQRSREDEDAIEQVINDMTAAFNRHDSKNTSAVFTQDADFVDVRGTWLKGAAVIERERTARFETVQKEARVRQLDMRIRFVTPDVAIARTSALPIPSRASFAFATAVASACLPIPRSAFSQAAVSESPSIRFARK